MRSEEHLVAIFRYWCDLCNEETSHPSSCDGCLRHMCRACRVVRDEDPWTREHLTSGDRIDLCPACAEALKPHAAEAAKLRDQVDEQVEAIEQKWRRECERPRAIPRDDRR